MLRNLAAALVAVLAYVMPAHAGQELKSLVALDSGPFTCPAAVATQSWTNTTDATMYVRIAQIWMGMTKAGVADYWTHATRMSDGAVLAIVGWDHYKDPDGLHQWAMNYQPDFMSIAPGDGIVLTYDCNVATSQPTLRGHVSLTIWYTDNP